MAALVAQVRNATLARVGILSDDDLASFELYPVRNGVGTWRIELPNLVRNAFGSWVKHAMAHELAQPGAGIVVALPGGRRVSGPMVTPAYSETTDEPRGKWTFTGVTDTVVLADRLAFPNPNFSDAKDSSNSRAYDTRSGPAETLMHAYVSANIGPDGSIRRDPRIIMGTDLARGASRIKSARFPTLLELCQELAAPDGLNFEVVQVGDKLEFRTSVPADLSADIRLDVANDTLDSADYSYSGPAATTVIVLGAGEAEERAIVVRTAPPTAWDRIVEVAVDARGSEDVDELAAKGDEVIATNGGTITSLDVVPTAANATAIGTKWWLGDIVTVNVAGLPIKATVSKVRLTLGPDGLYAGATVGDATGFDPDRVSSARVSNVESRVSSLERTAEAALPSHPASEWAAKSGPTAYQRAFVTSWDRGIDSGGTLSATTDDDGILIGTTGIYEVTAQQRGTSTADYIGIALDGDRTALETRVTGVWTHDHASGANTFSTSHYMGLLNEGELITAGAYTGGTGIQQGAQPTLGALYVRRLS